MPAFICTTCGTQYEPSDQPPPACPICEEELENNKAKKGKDTRKAKAPKAVDIWIPKARLEYLPWARYCVRHQEAEERNRESA